MNYNPYHAAAILGGMWGLKTHLDRLGSKFIFNQIVDKIFSKKFNPNSKSPKGYDQVFLATSVYDYIIYSSLEHDSYLCNFFPTSKPFPTRRIGNCFVGCIGSCNQSAVFYPCPRECRPKNHSNWIYC
ncbi:hypothetical protein BpHYR1_028042 [Brachionus plicatilis]|uniref:Uncharacterized protein n=1 Tax=Brachionus plicatilis TaxID=10195 RepID=A0A3M7Q839_BRAPC|nr:hypothetical protein BpHYR1_028042 [Brachionus plicatilis]